MPNIKSAAEIAAKWARVTPQRETDFKEGVQDPKVDWAGPTEAAAPNFAAGVQAAISRGAFERGVSAAGTSKWRRKVVDVGTTRWGPGVRAAQPDFQKGFEPFREIIASISLPARAPKGDPRNIERAAAMARALHEAKTR